MKILTLAKWPHRAAIVKWSAILLIAAGMQNLVLLPLQAATPKKKITDSGITTAVEAGFNSEKGVSPNDVDVSTSQGIVTLSGSVANLLAKDRAVQIAESIRGVLGVIDLTTVTPLLRPDEDIRKDILTALSTIIFFFFFFMAAPCFSAVRMSLRMSSSGRDTGVTVIRSITPRTPRTLSAILTARSLARRLATDPESVTIP